MLRLGLQFDLRAPAGGPSTTDLYAAAVDQCAWADGLGFETVYIGEHHGAEDGYCPSPIVVGAAIASRTSRIAIHLSALIAVLHNPLRLAEDLAVLDILSNGRLVLTLGIGYRPHEYAMFGVSKAERAAILESTIEVLDRAWTGEAFDHQGVRVLVRPTPARRPRPPIYIGGSLRASALRAARYGDNYLPAGDATLFEVYRQERERLGLPVGEPPPVRGPMFVHVTRDPEADWPVIGPAVLYAANSYADWATERGGGGGSYTRTADLDALRRNPSYRLVTPAECVEMAETLGDGGELIFQPLFGGIEPERAWRSLRLFESAVLPELETRGLRPARSGD
ncbi:LLM class flavin-dependent oxidoreductase [Dactylosporangium sp. CA-092794]|uniref:LLM class flavin-dependent oxidoreductase n=1 Tax=Dactylosporangium sp. CA-092794 TaxID=3239929 RepID=UPI003D94D36C